MSNLRVVQTFRLTKRQKTGGEGQPPAVYDHRMQGSIPLVEVMDAKGKPTGTYMVHLESFSLDGVNDITGVRCFAGATAYLDAAKYAGQHIDGAKMTRADYQSLVNAQVQADAAERLAAAMEAFDKAEQEAAETEGDDGDDAGESVDGSEQLIG